ncbi:MAG: tripartite tricarboxylate transporter TctB family protein [Hyphomicrobiaceae bacterium]
MTVRVAELLMAIIMAVFSAYLMWKSAELPIGWIPDEGPGGGFWPFWLAAIMFLSCIGILFNWVTRRSKPSQSTETFITMPVLMNVGVVALALGVTIFLMSWLGTYVALFLFLLFYIGVLGRHGVIFTLLVALIAPIVTFFFFEVLLSITLPKGKSDPYFKPVFARVYQCPRRETWGGWARCYIDPKWK